MGLLTTSRELWRRVGASCHYCDAPLSPNQVTVDHRVPRCRGGGSTPGNIVPACQRCNGDKGPLTEVEYLAVRHDPKLRKQLVVKVSKMVEQIQLLQRQLANQRYALGIAFEHRPAPPQVQPMRAVTETSSGSDRWPQGWNGIAGD